MDISLKLCEWHNSVTIFHWMTFVRYMEGWQYVHSSICNQNYVLAVVYQPGSRNQRRWLLDFMFSVLFSAQIGLVSSIQCICSWYCRMHPTADFLPPPPFFLYSVLSVLRCWESNNKNNSKLANSIYASKKNDMLQSYCYGDFAPGLYSKICVCEPNCNGPPTVCGKLPWGFLGRSGLRGRVSTNVGGVVLLHFFCIRMSCHAFGTMDEISCIYRYGRAQPNMSVEVAQVVEALPVASTVPDGIGYAGNTTYGAGGEQSKAQRSQLFNVPISMWMWVGEFVTPFGWAIDWRYNVWFSITYILFAFSIVGTATSFCL